MCGHQDLASLLYVYLECSVAAVVTDDHRMRRLTGKSMPGSAHPTSGAVMVQAEKRPGQSSGRLARTTLLREFLETAGSS